MKISTTAPFVMWEFEGEEERSHAQMLSDMQVANIQNELAAAAFERASLAVGDDETKFLRELEFIRGKMEMCAYLLACNDSARETLAAVIAAQASNGDNQ